MAINPSTNATMAGRVTAADANYPYGSSKDETAPGAGDGTPYFKARADDIFGFQQALLAAASIVPSGSADNAVTSQYLNAIRIMAAGLPYSATVDYPVGVYVKGSDGFLYKALIANGPASTVVNPVGDTTGVWVSAFRALKGAPGATNSSQEGYTFESDGDTGMFAEGGDAGSNSDVVLRSDGADIGRFTTADKSTAVTGYVKLPSGVIIQWGEFTQADDTTTKAFTFNLPLTFPNAGLQAVISPKNQLSASVAWTIEGLTTTQATGFTIGSTASRTYRIIAIGH